MHSRQTSVGVCRWARQIAGKTPLRATFQRSWEYNYCRTLERNMGQPAARLTDMHVCPMVTGVVPHVGGPIVAPGAPTVLIGGLPAARVGDMCVCVGPPDVVALGSATVLISGQ